MLKFRTAAVSAAAVIGLAVIAGAQVPAKPDSAHRGDHGGRHGDIRGMRRGGMQRGGMRGERGFGGEGRLMKDLNLTDTQKSRIKAIHEKYQPQFKTLREQGRTQFESLRSARQKGDTSAAARQRFQAQRQQFLEREKALRTQEQNEIRGVLTADQRAKWDAAKKQREERFQQRQGRMRERRGLRKA